MKIIYKKMQRLWQTIDHKYRDLCLAAIAILGFSIIYSGVVVVVTTSFSKSYLEDQGMVVSKIISNDLKDNRGILKSKFEIGDYLKLKYVEDLLVLDPKGNILFPFSVTKEVFSGLDRFIDGDNGGFVYSNGFLHMVRPVVASGGYSKKLAGYVYLRLRNEENLILLLTSLGVLFIALAVLVYNYASRKELSSSINRFFARREGFQQLSGGYFQKMKDERVSASSMYEYDLRNLVKYSSDFILLLDNRMSVLELSPPFLAKFCSSRKYSEGKHIVDVLDDNSDSRFLIDSLNSLGSDTVKIVQNDRFAFQINRLRFPSSSYRFSIRIFEKDKGCC